VLLYHGCRRCDRCWGDDPSRFRVLKSAGLAYVREDDDGGAEAAEEVWTKRMDIPTGGRKLRESKELFCKDSGGWGQRRRANKIGVQLTRIRVQVVVMQGRALVQLDAIYKDCGEECNSEVVNTAKDDNEEVAGERTRR
jgi:hypothetical protein